MHLALSVPNQRLPAISAPVPPISNGHFSTVCCFSTTRRFQETISVQIPGPRELGGAADLINQYKLCRHHEFFCKRSLPLSISETHYLHNVVGDTSIRKGEGMELDQLVQNNLCTREKSGHIHPFDLDILHEAFPLRETTPVKLPSAEKGNCTSGKSKSEVDKKERKHKKHRDKDRDHKKHKNRDKDNNGDAGMNKNTAYGLKTEQLKEEKDRFIQKRRLAGFEDPPVSGHKKARIKR